MRKEGGRNRIGQQPDQCDVMWWRPSKPWLMHRRYGMDNAYPRGLTLDWSDKTFIFLSCLVTRGGDVSYAWYKGSNLLQIPGNITELVENFDVNGSHLYTCNVSNLVSWANHSLQLTQGCQRDHQGKWSTLGYKRGWRCGAPQPGSLQRRLDKRSPDWLPQSFAALPQVSLGL